MRRGRTGREEARGVRWMGGQRKPEKTTALSVPQVFPFQSVSGGYQKGFNTSFWNALQRTSFLSQHEGQGGTRVARKKKLPGIIHNALKLFFDPNLIMSSDDDFSSTKTLAYIAFNHYCVMKPSKLSC